MVAKFNAAVSKALDNPALRSPVRRHRSHLPQRQTAQPGLPAQFINAEVEKWPSRSKRAG